MSTKEKVMNHVFCAVEPKKGIYFNKVTERRTGSDFAKFLEFIAESYKSAKKVTLVMDNLNTHRKESLIRQFGEKKGNKLWSKFDVHYTPKHGSWLNQAEIAINMYSRQCLGKSRIPDIELLRKKTEAWNNITNETNLLINWSFYKKDARKKFKYEKI